MDFNQTADGRQPYEPMMDEPQDIAEVRTGWPPEPDDDDPRTLLAQDEDDD